LNAFGHEVDMAAVGYVNFLKALPTHGLHIHTMHIGGIEPAHFIQIAMFQRVSQAGIAVRIAASSLADKVSVAASAVCVIAIPPTAPISAKRFRLSMMCLQDVAPV
jgi:hypothetical protein